MEACRQGCDAAALTLCPCSFPPGPKGEEGKVMPLPGPPGAAGLPGSPGYQGPQGTQSLVHLEAWGGGNVLTFFSR